MSKLFGDRRVVGLLALLACAFMYQRIVVPLLPDPALSSDWDVPVDEMDPVLGSNVDIEEALAQPQFTLATAQYDLRNIDIGALVFNENPSRDPFIEQPLVVAPLAAVDLTVVEPSRPEPVARSVRPTLPRLTAIAFASDHRAAVLDNRIVKTGDALEQFSVTEIARHHVTLQALSNQQIFTLTLTP